MVVERWGLAARVLWIAVLLVSGGDGPGGPRSAGLRLAAASGGGFPSDAAAAACEAWVDQQSGGCKGEKK